MTPFGLEGAYRGVHAVYVSTHPVSDLSALDFRRQVAHFVAGACMVCLVPSYEGDRAHHLAEKVANYWRMTRICSNIPHEGQYPKLLDAEAALRKEMDAQYEILAAFLKDTGAGDLEFPLGHEGVMRC
jgi:hypothetical protein